MSSSTKKSSPSLVGGILKFLGLLLLLIVIIFVIGYCYLRFSMGIDIFDVVKKFNLLKQEVSESQIVTQPYNNEDITQGLEVLFGNNTIYTENGEEYIFNKDEFVVSELLGDVRLNDQQFAGVLSLFLNNVYSSSSSTSLAGFTQLKQVSFDNFKESGYNKSIDITIVSELDFSNFKKSMSEDSNLVVGIFNNLIPSSVYITSNITVTVDESNLNSFTTKSNYCIINKLSKEDSEGVFDLFNIVLGGSKESFVQDINSNFADLIFGNNEQEGFLNAITGYNSFSFEKENTNIFISLKKA